jgi:ATP-dependent Lon protease
VAGLLVRDGMDMPVNLLPLLPLRDIVVFPGMVVPLFVGREKSVAALEAAMAGEKDIFLLAQLDPGCDDPDRDDLYDTGVVASVLQLLKLPDGTVRVLVEGRERGRIEALQTEETAEGELLLARVEAIETIEASGTEIEAMMRSVIEQFNEYAKLNKKLSQDAGDQLGEIEDAGKLADTIAAQLPPRFPTSRPCFPRAIRSSGWRWSIPSWKANSACCRWSAGSVAA